MKVAVIKYNAGNVYSVINAIKRLGADVVLTDDIETILSADKVLLPGQGEASHAMASLRATHLDNLIVDLKQPLLGICIGQQLLCRHSEEGDVDCLGIFPVNVKRFFPKEKGDKVPAMGWNSLSQLKSKLYHGLTEEDFVYFVHSYYVPLCDYTIAIAEYINPFSASLHKNNFYTTQFHPEKSGGVGEIILSNFLNL